MGLLIFYLMLALVVSFLCSIMEAVILSVTPSYVAQFEKEGGTLGKRLRSMKDDIDAPLIAILSLNTVAHTVGAAGVGAHAGIVFASVSVSIISFVLTLLILIFSEIIPKTLGALYWRKLTPFVVRLLGPTVVITKIFGLIHLSRGIARILSGGKKKVLVSREELTALAEIGEKEGVLAARESRMLKNLFLFAKIRTRDIMTPRTVLFALPESSTVGDVLAQHKHIRFSRIPVYQNNRDQITGFVLKTDMLLKGSQDGADTQLIEMRRELLVVHDALPLPDLFERLMDRREHVALVVDEYGGTAGIVTLEDLLETLLGLEIVDEADNVQDMQALARAQWRKRAERLGIIEPEDE